MVTVKDKGTFEEFVVVFMKYFSLPEDSSINDSLYQLGIGVIAVEMFLRESFDATENDIGSVIHNINEDRSIAEIYELV